MSKKQVFGVPSQNTVPEQRRYPVEIAANQMAETTHFPTGTDVDGIRPFPMPKPKTIEECRGTGEYMNFSHTNGKE